MTTSIPTRIQRKRTKGSKLPPNTLCCTRPGKWANPFRVESCMEAGYANTKEEAQVICVDAFREWLTKGKFSGWWHHAAVDQWKHLHANFDTLFQYSHLACFCPLDKPCHVDVLIELMGIYEY